MRSSRVPAACVLVLLVGSWTWTYVAEPMARVQGDGYYTYLWAVTLAFDGDLDLTNQYQVCGDPWHMLRRRPSRDGQWPHNLWSIGPSLVWAPMLAIARAVQPLPEDSDPRAQHGCSGAWANTAVFGSTLMGLAALFLLYRLSRRYTSRGPALVAAAVIGMCSMLPYYAVFLPSYNHAAAAFGAALFFERWDATRGSRTIKRWLLLGVLLGVGMLMRAQIALFAIAPLFEWIAGVRDDFSRRATRDLVMRAVTGVVFAATALVVFFPQLYVWKHTYGAWLAMPQGPYYMRWGEPHIDGVLFGGAAGLLTFTPLMYLGVLGLYGGVLSRKTRAIAGIAALVFTGFLYVNASVWDWWGSATFGARRFTEVTPLLGLGVAITTAWLFRRAERRPARFVGWTLAALVMVFAIYAYGGMWGVATGTVVIQRDNRADHYARLVFNESTTRVEDAVGNPLAWPASIPFALAYDTHPKRYDLVRGFGAFYQEFETARVRERDNWDRIHPGYGPQMDYATDGWEEEPRNFAGRVSPVTNAGRARLLIPLFADDVSAVDFTWIATMPEGTPERVRREGAGRVAITWNGHPLAQADVPPEWATFTISMPAGMARVGVNEVWLEVTDGPIAVNVIKFRQALLPDDPNRMRDWVDLNGGPSRAEPVRATVEPTRR